MARSKVYLVPIDFSKTSRIALRRAAELARSDKAGLLLVHVIVDTAGRVPFQLREQFYSELREEARAAMEKWLRRLKAGSVECRIVVLRGANPAQLIANQAKKSRCSMIVIASNRRSGLKRLILGSVSETIIRYATCPVLIVK